MTLKEANAAIDKAYSAFTNSLKDFATKATSLSPEQRNLEFGNLVAGHAKLIDCLSSAILDVHNELDLYNDQAARVDLLGTTRNILSTTEQYWMICTVATNSNNAPEIVKSPNAFDTIQLLLNSFPEQPYHDQQRTKFTDAKINIHDKALQRRVVPDPGIEMRRIKLSVAVGVLSVGAVFAILMAKSSIDAEFAGMLQILFALGIGGLSAALIGGITFKLNSSWILSSTGGLAVFALIFFVEPVKSYDKFNVRVTLMDSSDNLITLQDPIWLDVDGRDLQSSQDGESYVFHDVSSQYANKERAIYLKNSPYVFQVNKRPRLPTKLQREDITLVLTKSPTQIKKELADSMITVTRTLQDAQSGHPLQFVKVSLIGTRDSQTVKTNAAGTFSLDINRRFHSDFIRIVVRDANRSDDLKVLLDSLQIAPLQVALQ